MIKLIHRYKQSIGIVFLFIAFCFAISGVTVDVLSGTRSRGKYAVKVNDKEFSSGDFRRAEERIESQYQQMFGDNYEKIAQSIRFNIPQQALDNIVDSHLLSESAHALGLAATQSESNEYIVNKLFSPTAGGPGFSTEAYRSFLQRTGASATEFENSVREDIVRLAFTGFLEDMGVPTAADTTALMKQQETTYTFSAVEITSQSVMKDVATPSDTEIQKYYESNATDFELPARVSYNYVTFDPSSFKDVVNVTPQDVELAYTDDQKKYTSPEQIKVRSIKVLFPKENDPKKMAAVSDKAKKIHEDALAQKSFETLVTLHSDDVPTKMAGGLRPWMSKSSAPKEYLTGVFDTPVGGIAPLIEADFGYEIVKVEEKKESALRPIEEVRGEIEQELRTKEAPAYASAAAKQAAQSIGGSQSLEMATAGSNRIVSATEGLLGSSQDPTPTLRGLTRQVLVIPKAEHGQAVVLDVGDLSVVVRVKEYSDPAPAPLSEVREKILSMLKEKGAKATAESKAKEMLDQLQKDQKKTLATMVNELGLSLSEGLVISRATPTAASFSALTPELKEDLFSQSSPVLLPKLYNTPDGFILAQLTAITPPEVASLSPEKVTKYADQAKQQAGRGVLDASIALLKSKAEIDFDPGILNVR